MKGQWWRSILEVIEHSFVSALMFIIVAAAAVIGSRVVAIASRQIDSKFVNDALLFLKHAMVVLEVFLVLLTLTPPVVKKLRSALR